MATYTPICAICSQNVVLILGDWFHLDSAQETKCFGPYNVHLESPTLNDVMEIGMIVRVNETGQVIPVPLMSADIELEVVLTNPETWEWEDEFSIPEGWELLTGFTGQYSYNGPIMHNSEFIGGSLERHILETPGYWVAVGVESHCQYTEPHCTEDSGCDCDPAGWAVAHKEFTNTETGE